jgi:alkanesulfonate monooxygenase SsuD/methylene tetrahydromethanopterin reductase-like flavin-dependent oxidoreductase (luciferase family)
MGLMRFGLDIGQQRLEFDEVVDRTRFAETLGFDGAWGFDHFVPMYGEGPGNCFEGMTTLAALALATTRIRLFLLVTGVTYRHPSLLAAQAMTVDHASHGRLELAMGAAWYEAEHRQLGMEFPSTGVRFDWLEDQLEIFKRLFTGDVVSYQGHRFNLENAQMRPVPVQRPHPPIWIGGSGRRRTLPLVARYADVWHSGPGPEYADLSAEVDRQCQAIGRDPACILRASSLSLSPDSFDEIEPNLHRLQELGVGYVTCGWPDQGRPRIEEFARRIMPRFASGAAIG